LNFAVQFCLELWFYYSGYEKRFLVQCQCTRGRPAVDFAAKLLQKKGVFGSAGAPAQNGRNGRTAKGWTAKED